MEDERKVEKVERFLFRERRTSEAERRTLELKSHLVTTGPLPVVGRQDKGPSLSSTGRTERSLLHRRRGVELNPSDEPGSHPFSSL